MAHIAVKLREQVPLRFAAGPDQHPGRLAVYLHLFHHHHGIFDHILRLLVSEAVIKQQLVTFGDNNIEMGFSKIEIHPLTGSLILCVLNAFYQCTALVQHLHGLGRVNGFDTLYKTFTGSKSHHHVGWVVGVVIKPIVFVYFCAHVQIMPQVWRRKQWSGQQRELLVFDRKLYRPPVTCHEQRMALENPVERIAQFGACERRFKQVIFYQQAAVVPRVRDAKLKVVRSYEQRQAVVGKVIDTKAGVFDFMNKLITFFELIQNVLGIK